MNNQNNTHIVLIGDSIFDNSEYVDPGDCVIDQLRANIPKNWKASLIAVDGDITSDVYEQLDSLPDDTTHAILSIGGNDALRVVEVLVQPTATVGEAMEVFTEIRFEFQNRYRELITQIKQRVDKFTICTVHDNVPGIEPRALTALALFNEIILKEAVSMSLPIIDLRLLCHEKEDYSSLSPIEPSKQGSKKIVDQIIRIINEQDFNHSSSIIYK